MYGQATSTVASCAWRSAGIVVHAHFQMNSHARSAILQLFHANNLRDILAVHRIVRRRIRESDKDTHAGIVGVKASSEINARFRGIDADGQVFEVIVAGL